MKELSAAYLGIIDTKVTGETFNFKILAPYQYAPLVKTTPILQSFLCGFTSDLEPKIKPFPYSEIF